jgi:pyridoxal phosphate enzyme (YggS family)
MNLDTVKLKITEAADKIGKTAEDIKLVVVSKGRSIEEMKNYAKKGVIFGESRLQDALPKLEHFKENTFHFIGNIQKNKIKTLVSKFSLIQSVYELEHIELINTYAKQFGKIQDILLQINISEEQQKGGVLLTALDKIYKKALTFDCIKVKGFMTIPKWFENSEMVRPYFRKMSNIFKRYDLEILSMGMSDDFTVAVEEGANMIRLGRILFE